MKTSYELTSPRETLLGLGTHRGDIWFAFPLEGWLGSLSWLVALLPSPVKADPWHRVARTIPHLSSSSSTVTYLESSG